MAFITLHMSQGKFWLCKNEHFNSVNPLYVIIGEADGYIKEGTKINSYLLQTQTKTKKC